MPKVHHFALSLPLLLTAALQTGESAATGQGFYRIVADAGSAIDLNRPERRPGPSGLRAEYHTYEKNKIYLRFFVGWVAGRKIASAKLRLTTSSWGDNDAVKRFSIWQLKDGVPGDARLGWDERALCAANAPGQIKDANDFDPTQAVKLGQMEVGTVGVPVKENDPCSFEGSELIKAIETDTNGYLTLMITNAAGGGNSCFQGRVNLAAGPTLEIAADGGGGVDMAQPTFVVCSGTRQTITGYGTGMGGDHAVKIPGNMWTENGQNLGTLSDRPDRLKEYFKTVYTDTGSNSLRLWWAVGESVQKDLPNWERGYITTGIVKAAKEAGVSRIFLCSNPPKRMWGPLTPDSYGIEPLSEAGETDYPEYLAEIAATLKKKHDLELYMITIANEDLRIRIKQWPVVVRNLRKSLDARGLTKIKISGVDWPNNDNYAWDRLMAIQQDPQAWKVFDVANTHSYAMSLTEEYYLQFIQGHPGKEFWITETGGSGPTQSSVGKDLIGHLMNDINHGAASWITHESGLAVHGDHGAILVGYDPNGKDGEWLSISPKYHYFKAITTAFPVGTQMRRVWGSSVGDAWYPGWSKPKALASSGKRSDGSWSFALLNTAEAEEPDAKRAFTLAVEELARIPEVAATVSRLGETTSTEVKPTQGPKYVAIATTTERVIIRYGVASFSLGPNEVITIRTVPVGGSKL